MGDHIVYKYDVLDITGADFVEVEIRADAGVLWIHVDGITYLRVCQIKNLRVVDNRLTPARREPDLKPYVNDGTWEIPGLEE